MPSNKRKRSSSFISSGSNSSQPRPNHRLPSESINPLSYSEGIVKQLRTAGLTADDLLPSRHIPDFPHRPIRTSHRQADDSDTDDGYGEGDNNGTAGAGDGGGGENSASKMRRRKLMRDAQEHKLGFLTNVVLRALEEGDIPRAKRAFGLLRRSEVRGEPVDLRRNALWSLGAEILMRDGEVRSRSVISLEAGRDAAEGQEGPVAVTRWGSAANMPQLRIYLESLVREYPYNRLFPDSISDLDFYPVLFSCEFYDAWIEHSLALERLSGEHEDWGDGLDAPGMDMPDYYDAVRPDDSDRGEDTTGRGKRLRQAKVDLGLRAMSAMQDMVSRMDSLMENVPYSRSVELLRLRGMAALYIGDLGMLSRPRTTDEEEKGNGFRQQEQERARTLFARMVKNGGQVDACTERWLQEWDVSDDGFGADADDDEVKGSQWGALPVFSSISAR